MPVGNMIVTVQTLNGIAMVVESPRLADPEATSNVISLNQYTALAYHETLPLAKRMVETILRPNVDLGGDVVSIATQADGLFKEFVSQNEVTDPIGFLFLGYTPGGQGAMLGWFHAGDQTKTTRFVPFCMSRSCAVVGYLVNKLYTPDISLSKALELAAYAMTQSRIALASTPMIEYDRFNLAIVHPDEGFSWLSKEATESIIGKSEERDRALRIECAELFVEGD
jgi:hypothetical protein